MNIKLILLGLFIMFGSIIGPLFVAGLWVVGSTLVDFMCIIWCITGTLMGWVTVLSNFGLK